MRVAILDTYYKSFLDTLTLGNGTYEQELDKVLARQFGTADFYSREFRKIGWEAIDIIANYGALQELWWKENSRLIEHSDFSLGQIGIFKPDVVFLQDLSALTLRELKLLKRQSILVAQLSCEYGAKEIEAIQQCHTVFTSFPHYVKSLNVFGVNAVYMPLAFHESVLKWDSNSHKIEEVERDIDVSFVGGIGRQWTYGREVLEAVAREIPTAQFYGYGYESLPDSSPLKQKYKGPAWGDEMYRIYQRSKIVINRHGEIAGDYANNMRLYEATGCGALLLTEPKRNLTELFELGEYICYTSPDDAVSAIKYWLGHEKERADNAANGQRRTLRQHTYAHRIPQIAEVLEKALVSA